MITYLEELLLFMNSLTPYEHWQIEDAIDALDYRLEIIRKEIVTVREKDEIVLFECENNKKN